MENGKGFSRDIWRRGAVGNCQRFAISCDKFRKGFKEKDAVKNACDGVVKVLEFIQTGNYFHFNSFISFFETILFIWLNPLVPGAPNLYPQ